MVHNGAQGKPDGAERCHGSSDSKFTLNLNLEPYVSRQLRNLRPSGTWFLESPG